MSLNWSSGFWGWNESKHQPTCYYYTSRVAKSLRAFVSAASGKKHAQQSAPSFHSQLKNEWPQELLIFIELNKCIMTTPFSQQRHFPIFRYGRSNMKMESHHAALHRHCNHHLTRLLSSAVLCNISSTLYYIWALQHYQGPSFNYLVHQSVHTQSTFLHGASDIAISETLNKIKK